MSWPEITALEVRYTAQTKIRCFGCSKRLSRQRTFVALRQDGQTTFEVRAELRQQASRWNPRGVCADCMRTGQYVMLDDGNFALKFPGSGEGAA